MKGLFTDKGANASQGFCEELFQLAPAPQLVKVFVKGLTSESNRRTHHTSQAFCGAIADTSTPVSQGF